MTSRAALAAPLLLQTPPGQLANVYEDLSGLVGSEGEAPQADEEEFKRLSSRVREEHNLEQHIVVDLPDGKGKSVLCTSAAHIGQPNRFLAPREQISFVVDHESLITSDPKPYKPNSTVESFRSLLQEYLSVYVQDRYATGLVDVFAVPLPRVQIPVKEETIEAAKEETKDGNPPQNTVDAAVEEGGEQEVQDEVMNEEDGEGTEDKKMEDVEDDPVATAEAMKEVEETEDVGSKEVGMSKEASSSTTPPALAVEEEDTGTEGETKLVIHIVANKYKLSNLWSGRWRSTYILSSPSATDIDGEVKVQIHYFEEGNVQLNSNKSEKLSMPSEPSDDARAKGLVRSIEKFEANYQEELFNNCNELSEGAFKSLRRQLPMTKQKVDWDKVLNYKLGSELTE